jgi:MoxR-like ATPase
MSDVRSKLLEIEAELNSVLVNQENFVHGMLLSVLADTNILALGPPGVGKSFAVRLLLARISEGKYYQYLLGQYTTPEDLFGPIDILALEKDGSYKRIIKNRLADADIAFIDEVFKGNAGVINALLKVMNEREYDDNGESAKLRLLSIIAASNELPEEADGLGAALDRFGMKFLIRPVSEAGDFIKVLQTQERLGTTKVTFIGIPEILAARDQIAKTVVFPEGLMRTDMVAILQALSEKQIHPSPRVWANSIKVIKAQAWLAGRTTVKKGDLYILKDILWSNPDTIKDVTTIVMRQTLPEKQEIDDQYERASEIFGEYAKAWKRVQDQAKAGSKDAASSLSSTAMEYASKMRAVTVSLSNLEKKLQTMIKDPQVVVKPDMAHMTQTIMKVAKMSASIVGQLDPTDLAKSLDH